MYTYPIFNILEDFLFESLIVWLSLTTRFTYVPPQQYIHSNIQREEKKKMTSIILSLFQQ